MDSSAYKYSIAAFYHFGPVPKDQLKDLSKRLEDHAKNENVRGLVILATEGVNGTISAESKETLEAYLNFISETLSFPKLEPKWSGAEAWPFRKFAVRIRPEIVTLGKPEVQPLPPHSPRHLSPEEWHRMMEEEDVIVLDTRNWYETKIGKFAGAIDPNIEEFREFSDFLDKSDLPKDKKILIYCTGGIRCEKAIVEMENKGFTNVYQLDGGILNYLAKFPNQKFEGECFVFDHRVAVDQYLNPTKQYKMCPHCGQPADQKIQCRRCETEAVVCIDCLDKEEARRTCSKNCAHHYRLAPGKKGRPQFQGYRSRALKQLRQQRAQQNPSAR